MTEQINTPELRFPEFYGEWEENQLSTILEIGTGKSKVQSNENGKYNILGSTGIIGKSHTYDYEGDFILTARVGHYAGKLYKHAGKVNISDNTIYLYNFINKNFIYESLNVFKLEKLVFGSGQPLIKASDLKKLKIRVPVSKEQKKIGTFFSKLDRQIELEEEKLELLEQQKRGYMQKIFSQQLRFKDEKGNDYPKWIFKKFEEIFKVVPSKKYQIKSSEIEDNASIPVIDQGQNLILGFSNNKEKVFNDFKNVIIYGDHTTVIKRSDKPFIIGGDGVKLLTSKVDSDISYLYNALQYFNVKSEGYKRHFSILKNKDFYISTSIEEQKRIANIFNKLDKYIEKQFAKVELLKQRKQGLLQKMFV
ncbi:restriction endonuclease subunit S [Staphylococcus epidermidis]|nr:restriction endonuclease subunit S [Staphylococcus epidermidis]MCO6331674.1 restriction endonuclease subunit S [Staphylococcus epidermidis]